MLPHYQQLRKSHLNVSSNPFFQFRVFRRIRMATGLLTSADTVSEVVLFTTDSSILGRVAQHDEKAGN